MSVNSNQHGDTLAIKLSRERLSDMEQCKVDAINDFLAGLYEDKPTYYIFKSLKSDIIVLNWFKASVISKFVKRPGTPLCKEYKDMLDRIVKRYGSIEKWAQLPGNQIKKVVMHYICSWIAKLSDGDIKLSDFEVLYLPFCPYVSYEFSNVSDSFELTVLVPFVDKNFKGIGELVDLLNKGGVI